MSQRSCETCAAPLTSGQLRFCSRYCYGRSTSPLTASQAEAVLTLYSKGWPAHQIAAAIWQNGYKSPDACRASISRWLRRRGLNRTRSEAQKLSFAQGRIITDTQKQAIRDARKAYFERLHAHRTHCFNGHPISAMRVWVNEHGVERRQCRVCYRERYERYKRGEKRKPKTPPKKKPGRLPAHFYKDTRRVPAQPIRDAITHWRLGTADPAQRSLEVLAERLAVREGGDPGTYRRRLIAPLMTDDTTTFSFADVVLTAIDSDAWYGELADLYDASWDEAPATPKRPSAFMLTCPKCSHRTPDKTGVDSCEKCGTRLFPHAKRAA